MNLDHHDGEDILQRVLLKLWEKLPEFEYNTARGSFRSFLCTIIRNMAIDFLKKKSRMLKSIGGEEKVILKKYLDQVSLPEIENIAEREWKLFLSNTAWQRVEPTLTEKVKKAYLMLLKGQALESVAKELQIQNNTVYVYKLRVIEKIQREIKLIELDLSSM